MTPFAEPPNVTLPLAVPPPAAGSCITSLMTVVELALAEKPSVLPTPSPPLATGLPSVIVEGEPDEPSVTDLPLVVMRFPKVRLPPAVELIIVNGLVNVNEFVPVKFIP